MERLPLTAFHRGVEPGMAIVPADRGRQWMNGMTLPYANRCLPLLIANESGWWLLNERAFTATWNGDDHARGVVIDYGDAQPPRGRAVSIFGYGVLTFEISWLFRTPQGWSLLVRGPANLPRDGIAPLEGVVETDWAVATFTMNWRFTRPGSVTFGADDPFCMVVPQRRRELERFQPHVRGVTADPATEAGWESVAARRSPSGSLHLRFGRDATFHVDLQRETVVCAARADAAPLRWQRFLLDTVLWATALVHGRVALHAAAVADDRGAIAVAAGTAGGKTSLALEFLRRGRSLVADDVLVVADAPHAILAYPAPPVMNVDIVRTQPLDPHLGRVLHVFDGEAWVGPRATAAEPVPLRGIAILARGASASPWHGCSRRSARSSPRSPLGLPAGPPSSACAPSVRDPRCGRHTCPGSRAARPLSPLARAMVELLEANLPDVPPRHALSTVPASRGTL